MSRERIETDALLRRWALGLCLGVTAFSVAVLVSWSLGRFEWLAIGEQLIPTAPGTGIIALLLASALALRIGTRGPVESPVVSALAGATVVFCAAIVWGQLSGNDLALERWLSGTDERRGGIRIGRVSQYTAGLFGLFGIALLLRRGTANRQAEAVVLSGVFAVSLVFLQGYLLGAPLLYHGGVIPVAAPTAAMLAILAASALLTSGPDVWPIRLFVAPPAAATPPTTEGFRALVALLGVVVVSSGYFWYDGERQRAERRAAEGLETVTTLKAREVGVWFAGLRAAAEALRAAPIEDAALRSAPQTGWLGALQRDHQLHAVAVVAPSGHINVRVGGDARDDQRLAARVRVLPPVEQVQFDDLAAVAGEVTMLFWVPVASGPAAARQIRAWIALVVDPTTGLYPMLAEVPLRGGTGEFLLWRPDGEHAVLVSPRRSTSVAPFAERIALDSGTTAALYPIPGSPWWLSADARTADIALPLRAAAVRATGFTLLFLLALAAAVYALLYRRNLARASRELRLIAEREASVDELRRSEARYARAMHGSSDGLWDWDLTTEQHFVSPRWLEIVGVSEEDARSAQKGFFERLHPDDVPRVQGALDAHLERGAPYDLEVRLRHGDGSYRWIWTRGEAERDGRGTPLRMAGAITDVTARRQAEDALARSDRVLRIRTVVNQAIVRAPDERALLQAVCDAGVREGGFVMAWIGAPGTDDAKSVVPLASSGDTTGYLQRISISWGDGPTGQGPTGRCLRSGLPEVAQHLLSDSRYAPWRDAAAAAGFQSAAAIPLRVAGDSYGALMLYADVPSAFDADEIAVLVDLAHDVAFGIAALRDRAALNAQQAQLALFRQVIDHATDAVFVADAATGRFIDFNRAALDQLGYTAEELRTLGPTDIAPSIAAAGDLAGAIARARESEGALRPSVHRRKDGLEIPVEITTTVVDLPERTVLLAVARDVSEREGLQHQLLRAQRMESVGRLAGGIAHDFNNLLTVINATADLLIQELPEGAQTRHDILQIRAAGERASGLTRQLLAFSRQQVMRRQVLSLNDAVTAFLKMLKRVIGEDIQVAVDLEPDLGPVFADPGQLEQVLMNLSVNARDAMPRGGTLAIGTGVAVIDDEHAARKEGLQTGHYALLTVSDTGVGMDRRTQSRIFEPFFTTKDVGRGTGLGLSTVYGIVKQTGGSIWCYSELGQGTTFRIYLPFASTDIVEAPSAPKTLPQRGTETVLVVEDEDSIRLVVRRVLERSGYTVLEAASGPEALALVAAHEGPLHLVMTDLVMPGMTGIELSQALRSTRPGLKLLFTSGYSADVVRGHFQQERSWNFISKPYSVRELAAEVRRVLDA